VEVVASLSHGRTAAAQCGLFTHKSVPVIFEPPCNTAGLIAIGDQVTLQLIPGDQKPFHNFKCRP